MAKTESLKQIIVGCKKGDADSFSQLLDIYAKRLYGYFYRLTGSKNDSDDLLGELFLKLVDKIRLFKGGTFESWLFKIASNIFYDHLRGIQKQRKLIVAQTEHIESKTTNPGKSESGNIDKLQSQLEKLDPDTKEVIFMRFYSELSFKEIASMRSEPIGTTLSKAHRGLKKLRELME